MPIYVPNTIEDEGLTILNDMSNEELEVLVRIIIDKGKLTERLTSNKRYKQFAPDHQRYTDLISKELIAFGSHTLYFNKRYKDIVRDVCGKMKVPFDKKDLLKTLEQKLLSNVLEQTWENMSEEERRDLFEAIGEKNFDVSGASSAALLGLFQAGGAASIQLTLSIVGSIAATILGGTAEALVLGGGATLIYGSGAAFAASTAASRILGVLTGPIGIALTTAFTLKQLGGPAYRVTMPAVIYIAGMRMLHENKAIVEQTFVEEKTVKPLNVVKEKPTKKPLSLKRKKKAALLPDKMFFGFGWMALGESTVDVVAFMVDGTGHVSNDEGFIFFNQPKHESGAIEWINDLPPVNDDVELIRIDGSKLPSNVQSIKLFLVIDDGSFNAVINMFVRLVDDSSGQEIFRRAIDGDFSNAKSIEVGAIVRQSDGWIFEFNPRGSDKELVELCKRFGVNAK